MAAGGRNRRGGEVNLPNWDRNSGKLQVAEGFGVAVRKKMGRVSEFAEKGREGK